MSTFFPTRPFAGNLHRPLFRALLCLFIFGAFFLVFLPHTHVLNLMNAPHFPGHHHPLLFDPPQPGSNRHRINVQRPITPPDAHRNKDVWALRADAVRDAFLRAYNSYVTYASPYDELLPLSKAPMNKFVFFNIALQAQLAYFFVHSFNGWALSHIESLDTLWLMGLYEEFDGSLAVIANTTFSLPPVSSADPTAT